MEGSAHRIKRLTRAAVPTAILVGVIALTGCGGGGGGDKTAKAPAPVNNVATPGGVVSADGTQGLVGPAGRATAKSQQFDDKTGKIPANANHRPKNANGVAGGENCTDTDLMPSDSNSAQLNASILCLVNGERAAQGLGALAANDQLSQAAAGMCNLMVTQHFFAHETPDGKTVVDRVEPTGYIPNDGDWVVGENLAWGSGALSTPQAIVNGWMNSPGHKANILAPDYKDLGLAACMGSPKPDGSGGGTVYVNDFGAKSGADVNLKLPSEGEGGDSGSTGNATAVAATTVAGAKTAKAKAKAKAKKAKKKAKHKRKKRH